MSRLNNISPISSTPSTANRASENELRARHLDMADATIRLYRELEERIAALEAALAVAPQADVVPFAQSRPSWTVKQLASDLNMNEQTVRNFLALPDEHQQKLHSFQANPGGAHHLLPEHVADWLRRNESQAA